jgi:hypothetical protein
LATTGTFNRRPIYMSDLSKRHALLCDCMADTLSSDSKTVVQALYDAIAAGDVERFFGAMHSQFEAELPGYLPWGGIHNGPDAFKANVLPGMASKIDLASIKRVPIGDSRTWP